MKVLVADSDPRKDVVGGIGVYAASLAQRLSLRDDVLFIGKCQAGKKRKRVSYKVFLSNEQPGQNNLLFYKSLFRTAKQVEIPETAVVHAQRPDWIIPFKRHPGKKVITLHGSHYKNLKMKKGWFAAFVYGYLERKGFKVADAVIAVDKRTREEYRKKYPFAKDKVITVPVGIDTSFFVPLPKTKVLKELGLSSKRKIFLFVGRLSKEKRVELMIKALAKDEVLLVIGTGEEEDYLKGLAVNKDVRFLGAKGQEELVKYYNAADALLLFSTHEGLPTVALESLACGTPVVATRVGELPDLIGQGSNGFLVKGSAYRKAMDSLLKKSGHLGKDSRKSALPYDWKQVVKRLEEVYS